MSTDLSSPVPPQSVASNRCGAMQPSGKYQKSQHRRQREHIGTVGDQEVLCVKCWSWLYLSGSVGFDDVFSFSVRRKCHLVLVKVWSNTFPFSRRKFHVTSSTLHLFYVIQTYWIELVFRHEQSFEHGAFSKLWLKMLMFFSPFFPFLSVDKSVWLYCK